ncbi:MAG: hypothetical protein QOF30_1275 [Acidimicrobiaceae bacterium]|nr:hypothetical protein [Acidimicrobiaceae bacterium]
MIGVSSLGPTTTKADYSNYGTEQTDVSAPGGYFRDGFGTPSYRSVTNLILSAYPESLARASGSLDPDGSSHDPFVVRDCEHGVCAYYQYLQGTSMAAPHATGVAALVVSKYGHPDPRHPGLFLPAAATGSLLRATATRHDCPTPRLQSYADVGRTPDYDALCQGGSSEGRAALRHPSSPRSPDPGPATSRSPSPPADSKSQTVPPAAISATSCHLRPPLPPWATVEP